MKMTLITAAIIAVSSMATAADIGDNLIRSNVPSATGSVPGFLVLGEGYFVEAAYADQATIAATVLPEGLNSKRLDDVLAYLEARDIDASPRLASAGSEYKAVTEIVDGKEVETLIPAPSRVVNGGW